jgi:hypothetical protein
MHTNDFYLFEALLLTAFFTEAFLATFLPAGFFEGLEKTAGTFLATFLLAGGDTRLEAPHALDYFRFTFPITAPSWLAIIKSLLISMVGR